MTTFVASIIFLVLLVNAHQAYCKVPPKEIVLLPINDVCLTSKCRNVGVEECTATQVWLPSDVNNCCSRCADCSKNYCSEKFAKCLPVGPDDCGVGYRYNPANVSSCNCCPYCTSCIPAFCAFLKCVKPICKWNEVYISGAEACNCCGSCKKVECDPTRCQTVRCGSVSQTMEQCREDEIYVNPSGICGCCEGSCKKIKVISEVPVMQAIAD